MAEVLHKSVLESKEDPIATTRPAAKNRHEEYQYLDLIRDIIDNGEFRPDRYGSSK